MLALACLPGALGQYATSAPVSAATYLCPSPQIAGVSPNVADPGSGTIITVSGSGLDAAPACSETLTVAGQRVDFQHSGSSLSFPLSGRLNGPVAVSQTDTTGASNVSNSNLVLASRPAISGVSPNRPTTGQTVTVSGSGLAFVGLPAPPSVSGIFGSGGGTCATRSPLALADTSLSFSAPSAYCNGALQVSFRILTNTDAASSPAAYTTVTLPAGPIDVAASVGSLSPASAVPGTGVTVSGSGFGTAGSATIAGLAAPSSWQDTAVTVTVPAEASSGSIVLHRGADGAVIQGGNLTVQSQVTEVSPPAAAVGDAVTISGAGFGTPPGAVLLGAVPLTVSRWSATSITVSLPGGVSTGPLLVRPPGNAPPLSPPTLSVLPRITAADPGHGGAGAMVRVTGTSFGTQTGTVTIGGQAATVALWSDGEVLVGVPSGLPKGPAQIVLTVPGAPSAATFAFTVDPGPSPSAVAIAPPPILPKSGAPIISTGPVPFHPLRNPPSPVQLTLGMPAHANPGATVPFTVSLVAFGKPVTGAPVTIQLVVVPGADARLSPTSAVTDAQGQVRGTLVLSRTPGDHIILARSGLFSDEIRLVGGTEPPQLAAMTQPHAGQGPPVALLLALIGCVLLLLAGAVVNLVTSPALDGAGAARFGRFGGAALNLRTRLTAAAPPLPERLIHSIWWRRLAELTVSGRARLRPLLPALRREAIRLQGRVAAAIPPARQRVRIALAAAKAALRPALERGRRVGAEAITRALSLLQRVNSGRGRRSGPGPD